MNTGTTARAKPTSHFVLARQDRHHHPQQVWFRSLLADRGRLRDLCTLRLDRGYDTALTLSRFAELGLTDIIGAKKWPIRVLAIGEMPLHRSPLRADPVATTLDRPMTPSLAAD